VGVTHFARAEPNQNSLSATSANQSGGQTGGIVNNNGPITNAPAVAPPAFCPDTTSVCVDTSAGGTVKDVHMYNTRVCRPKRFLGIGGKGEMSNITADNMITMQMSPSLLSLIFFDSFRFSC
jgi:hypothetical protein